jgi:hypothetical protein
MAKKKIKYGVYDRRQQQFCKDIKRYEGGLSFDVEWRKSKTWGHSPTIRYRGESLDSVTGCGFDKLSTILANCLRWLVIDDPDSYSSTEDYPKAYQDIWCCGGAGVGKLEDTLKEAGWRLERTYTNSSWDGFSVERIKEH